MHTISDGATFNNDFIQDIENPDSIGSKHSNIRVLKKDSIKSNLLFISIQIELIKKQECLPALCRTSKLY